MGWRKTETKNATTWVADDVIPKGWPTPQAQRAIGTAISRGQQAPGALPFSRMSREEPTQIAAVESHVTVPLLWSLITGGIISLLVLPLFIVLESPYWWLAFWVGALAMLMMWLHRIGGLDVVMWKVENIVGKDISGDGVVGKPEPTEILARIESDTRKPQDLFLQFNLSKEMFGELARAALADMEQKKTGGILAEKEWSKRVPTTTLRPFKDALVDAGLAAWRNPSHHNQGCELTKAGLATFRAYIVRTYGPGVQNQDGSADGEQ